MERLRIMRPALLLSLLAAGCSNAAAPDLSEAPNSSFGVTKDQFQADQNAPVAPALPMAGMVAEPAPAAPQPAGELPAAEPLPADTTPEPPVVALPDAGVPPTADEPVVEPPPMEEPTDPLWPLPLPEEEDDD